MSKCLLEHIVRKQCQTVHRNIQSTNEHVKLPVRNLEMDNARVSISGTHKTVVLIRTCRQYQMANKTVLTLTVLVATIDALRHFETG